MTKTKYSVPVDLRHFLGKSGSPIHFQNLHMEMTSWDFMYHLLRANFDGIDNPYVKPPPPTEGHGKAVYDYGHILTGLQDAGDKVTVTYTDREGKEHSATVDLVIGADGPSSSVRRMMRPDIEREYAGYVAWRGTIPESKASEECKNTIVEKITHYYSSEGMQALAYTIPGKNGTITVGERLLNFVWYVNYEKDSPEYDEIMTDVDGKQHRWTLPAGKINPKTWEAVKERAKTSLPPQMAEMVVGCEQPFIQCIADVPPEENLFMDGKVMLIGDAFSAFRPHTAASTNQAALDARLLGEVLQGKMEKSQWKDETFAYAKQVQQQSVDMGNQSQTGNHPLAD